MQNWSRQHQWQPSEVCYPTTEEEVVGIVHKAATERKKIRIIGCGHSFTPLYVTNDYLVSLRRHYLQADR